MRKPHILSQKYSEKANSSSGFMPINKKKEIAKRNNGYIYRNILEQQEEQVKSTFLSKVMMKNVKFQSLHK